MTTPTDLLAQQQIYAPNIAFNSSLLTIKFLSSSFTGSLAGILGLSNLSGFLLFILSTLFTSLCISTLKCQGKPAKYMAGGWGELLNPGQENLFTFILVWTLFYGVVHVYD